MKMKQVYTKGSGSLAGTTARIVDGIMIVGERITENKSNTVKQIFQKDKQRFVRTVSDTVKLDIVDNFWPKPRALVSGYNDFNSKNLLSQTKFVTEGTPFAPDKLKLIMSKGSLEGIFFLGINTYKTADGVCKVHWEPDVKASGEDTDDVVIVVYDIDSLFPYIQTGLTRNEGEATFTIPAGLTLANLVFIIFPWRMDGSKQLRAQSATIAPTVG